MQIEIATVSKGEKFSLANAITFVTKLFVCIIIIATVIFYCQYNHICYYSKNLSLTIDNLFEYLYIDF